MRISGHLAAVGLICAAAVGLAMIFCVDTSTAPRSTSVSDGDLLRHRLAYLNRIAEIDWVKINRNTVYIGFNTYPDDLEDICRAAAANGNRAINFGVHVWAVPAGNGPPWRPDNRPVYFQVTVRHGRIE